MSRDRRHAYWRANLRYLIILLLIWFVVSFGCGILFVEQLNTIRVGGFGLGFWFAQQGSIYVFVLLIIAYVWLMNRADRAYEARKQEPSGGVAHALTAVNSCGDDAALDGSPPPLVFFSGDCLGPSSRE